MKKKRPIKGLPGTRLVERIIRSSRLPEPSSNQVGCGLEWSRPEVGNTDKPSTGTRIHQGAAVLTTLLKAAILPKSQLSLKDTSHSCCTPPRLEQQVANRYLSSSEPSQKGL